MIHPKQKLGTELALGLLLLAATCGFFVFVFSRLRYQWSWAGMAEYSGQLFQGWLVTLGISLGALVVSALLGVLLMIGQRTPFASVRGFTTCYVELIRGTPLLVQLMIGYYVVSNALGLDNKIWIGIFLLSLFSSAYICEILRGGIESVGKEQIESARAVGFNRAQIYRYVIVPQALRRVLPALTGQFVNLVKDSSLLSVLGIEEFTQEVRMANASNYTALEGYLPLAVGYLILTIPISFLARRLERRMTQEV
ncbi:MAG: amino acid ABC transporter permease [Verrucomicrobiales bacterium]|nr:amino acid ABC transporter permease [Verrucomicrobiales bacterium]MDA7644180.1 amino acid ABC transporter permease [Verrucomicrobiales bacterium]